VLEPVLAEIESHVHAAGWDRRPTLFALVRAGRFATDDPATAARLGIDVVPPETLTPVEQEALPDGPLDEVLASIAWPDSVDGCVLAQEILVLPPSAEADLGPDAAEPDRAAGHPDRREARLVVGVLRDGSRAAVLRLRAVDNADSTADTDADPDGELLTGADLAPNLAAALLATFETP
jgi:hypothetical protein